MFTPGQFNAFLGSDFARVMELPLRLDIPVDETKVQGLSELGARKANTVWGKGLSSAGATGGLSIPYSAGELGN